MYVNQENLEDVRAAIIKLRDIEKELNERDILRCPDCSAKLKYNPVSNCLIFVEHAS